MRTTSLLLIFLLAAPALAGTAVSPQEAYELIAQRRKDKSFVILDVRTPKEFAAGHLPGAKNLDFQSSGFAESLAALDRKTTYLLHCAKGGRSGKTAAAMDKLGFLDVRDMKAGYAGWAGAGLPTTK